MAEGKDGSRESGEKEVGGLRPQKRGRREKRKKGGEEARCVEGRSVWSPARQKAGARVRLHAWRVHLSPTGVAVFHPDRTRADCVFGQIWPWAGKRSAICGLCLKTRTWERQSCRVTFPIRPAAERTEHISPPLIYLSAVAIAFNYAYLHVHAWF